MSSIKQLAEWSLFLDRDGVINQRIPGDYVKRWEEFVFLPGVLEVWPMLAQIFPRLFIVTNQQGIGKGLMTANDLELVHETMQKQVMAVGGRLDRAYYCPELAIQSPPCRKPNIGMAEWAKRDFPTVQFAKSIMVGDSISDMQFGWTAGMKTVFITTKEGELEKLQTLAQKPDLVLPRLSNLPNFLQELVGA